MQARQILAAMALGALWASRAHAGLYNPAEPEETIIDVNNFSRFNKAMEDLRMIPWPKVPVETPLRTRYLLAAELATERLQSREPDARALERTWNSAEKLAVSAYLIRREKYRDAQQLLERLITKEPDNFLALANLAAAYQKERVDEAIAYAKRAVKVWPAWNALNRQQKELVKHFRWDEDQFDHYRAAETCYLRLLERRRREPPKQPMEAEKLDDLFGDQKEPFRLVGESGRFEPGKLAQRERRKLPGANVDRAIQIVQQLLIWMPGDTRLLWQLAELYSVADKRTIDKKTVDHRVTANKVFDILTNPVGAYKYRSREFLESNRALAQDLQDNPPPPPKADDPGDVAKGDAPPEEDTGVRIDWKTLSIGFGAGLLVMLFVVWQVNEVRRRRQRRSGNRLEGMHPRPVGGEVRDTRIQVGGASAPPASPETHVRASDRPPS